MPTKLKLKAKPKSAQNFSAQERKILQRLSSPAKIQDFLDSLPMNFSDADPCLCPQQVLQQRTAHCMEGALLAAAALHFHGHRPLLLDLTTTPNDEDHVVALFSQGTGVSKRWGAISKTNHAVLRYREPVYKTVRELAMSYFHEYFLNSTGQKTLRTFSEPFDLSKFAHLNWLSSQEGIMEIIQAMSDSPHEQILTKQQIKNLRKADAVEIAAGKIVVSKARPRLKRRA
ncbi:MAG TPA: hypothetical protein VHQ41_03245 [Patescibacteria group bacterium]|jgi:hypothetical protein|nr:hypothetical protein [Patescibacteria group bacterium]